MARAVRNACLVWAGLLGLLALTVCAGLAPLGPLRLPASLLIAAVKAGLVVWFYMRLGEEQGLVRIFALAALVWLTLLLLLSGVDFASRGAFGAPA